MDALTFVVEILKATAWPSASIVIALVFRRELRQLLLRLRKGKVGPAEFEFEERVASLEADSTAGTPTPSMLSTEVASLAHTDPRAAILDAWLRVEQAATMLAERKLDLEPVLGRSPKLAVRVAAHRRMIDARHLELFSELRSLRNRAIHEPDFRPSTESVVSFIGLSAELVSALNKAAE